MKLQRNNKNKRVQQLGDKNILSSSSVGMKMEQGECVCVSKRAKSSSPNWNIYRMHTHARTQTHTHTHISCSVNSKKSLNCKKTFLHLFSIHTHSVSSFAVIFQPHTKHFFQKGNQRSIERMGSQLWFLRIAIYIGCELCELNKKRAICVN